MIEVIACYLVVGVIEATFFVFRFKDALRCVGSVRVFTFATITFLWLPLIVFRGKSSIIVKVFYVLLVAMLFFMVASKAEAHEPGESISFIDVKMNSSDGSVDSMVKVRCMTTKDVEKRNADYYCLVSESKKGDVYYIYRYILDEPNQGLWDRVFK